MDIDIALNVDEKIGALPQGTELFHVLCETLSSVVEEAKTEAEVQDALDRLLYPFTAHVGNLKVDLITPQGVPFDHRSDDTMVVVIRTNRSIH